MLHPSLSYTLVAQSSNSLLHLFSLVHYYGRLDEEKVKESRLGMAASGLA